LSTSPLYRGYRPKAEKKRSERILIEALRGTPLEGCIAPKGVVVIGGTTAEWVAGCKLASLTAQLRRWPMIDELRKAGVI
jgi:hypothetical protein